MVTFIITLVTKSHDPSSRVQEFRVLDGLVCVFVGVLVCYRCACLLGSCLVVVICSFMRVRFVEAGSGWCMFAASLGFGGCFICLKYVRALQLHLFWFSAVGAPRALG